MRRGMTRALSLRLVLITPVWWVLTEGSSYNLPVAMAVIVSVGIASMYMAAPPGDWRLSPVGMLRFALFFLRHSAAAGADVARRALHPALPIAPATIEYRDGLPSGAPQALFTAVVSLLPGTLSVTRSGNVLRVHVLDVRSAAEAELRSVERRVAMIFRSSHLRRFPDS